MSGWVCLIGHLKGGAEVGRSLGQKEGREWQPGRIEGRRAGGPTLGGRSRTHKVRVFHDRGLFGGVRRRQ